MKKLLVVNVGLTALLGSGMAHAGLSPFYVGAGIGSASNDGSDEQFCPECAGSEFDMDKKNTAHKVYGGVNITRNLAIEGEYTDLGNTYDLNMNRPTTDGRTETAHARQKTHGIGISAKASHHFANGKTSVFGKAGAFAWQNKNKMDYKNLDDVHETYKTTDNGISPTVGVGVEHELTDNWSVRAGWDRYYNVGKGDQFLHLDENKNYDDLRSVKTNTDLLYVGATFNF